MAGASVVGGVRFVSQRVPKAAGAFTDGHYPVGSVVVAVAVDGEPAGLLILADSLRSEAAQVIDSLRRLGITRIIMASGDRHDVAEAVTVGLHLDAVHADLTPDRKIAIVQAEKRYGPVMMIGDGVNDAPALAAADLGVAMGAKGAAASAEAADVVLLVDRLDKIPAAIQVARRSRSIALQSVYAGIGLSVVGMIIAAFGYLTPVQGALDPGSHRCRRDPQCLAGPVGTGAVLIAISGALAGARSGVPGFPRAAPTGAR